MKLNLGCGSNFIKGFLNVDKTMPPNMIGATPEMMAGIFMQYNLELFGHAFNEIRDGSKAWVDGKYWPWETNSIDEIHFIHSLEHMGGHPEIFRCIIGQMYRVCRDGAKIFIAAPHPRHDDYLNDPTHVRPITPQMFELFSRKKNTEWVENHISNSQLAFAWGVDFELVEANGILEQVIQDQNLDPGQIQDMVKALNNIVKEFQITLRVVKEKVH